ncbi:hypothetical protein SAMN05216577_11614 [Pseudomonas citronellolis]|uniref:Uncharacterized protein n=1 Tax=Pseudomonas citronellolis TaxID=53408 RepID=A0AAQ1HNY2_9PSED|nr:hypothetical protein [Pseudomonas citronellolis]TGC32384.1 hypothetical protein CW310_01810 [Pseudomonas citronellolis]SFD07382.1 hypothetical protein SAMN05216577_11614 [Pseudomonas citronellolis]
MTRNDLITPEGALRVKNRPGVLVARDARRALVMETVARRLDVLVIGDEFIFESEMQHKGFNRQVEETLSLEGVRHG